jgi:phosphatidate cytidylyltransferase
LRTRVLSACVLIPIVGALVYLGGWWLFGGMALVTVLCILEACRMLVLVGHRPTFGIMAILAGALLLSAQSPQWHATAFIITVGLLASISWQLLQKGRATPTADWAVTFGFGLYLGWLAGHFISIRALPDGMRWLAVALLITWVADTGAYCAGTLLGKNKLVPRLSPKKTWEGVIGGWIAAEIAGVAFASWLGLTTPEGIVMGLIASLVAPFGDLAISMIKRNAGVKDTGGLIPGHGGMLDRVDSLLFVVPLFYYFATWVR